MFYVHIGDGQKHIQSPTEESNYMFNHLIFMGKKHKYVVEGRQYHPESSSVDTEDEQTIWCCFARRKNTDEVRPIQSDNGARTSDNSLKQDLERCRKELTECRSEKEALLSRLSRMMGSKMVENNPQIANLNDANRPQKLADVLGNIYDNEWTEAYTYLLDVEKMTDRKGIEILLDILQVTYHGCLNHVHRFSEHVQGWFKDQRVSKTPHFIHLF